MALNYVGSDFDYWEVCNYWSMAHINQNLVKKKKVHTHR